MGVGLGDEDIEDIDDIDNANEIDAPCWWQQFTQECIRARLIKVCDRNHTPPRIEKAAGCSRFYDPQ